MPLISDDIGVFTIPGLSAGSLNADFAPQRDVSQYRWLSVSVNNNAYAGLLVPRWSNDAVVWNLLKMYPMTTLDAGDVSAAGISASNVILGAPVCGFTYFKMTMESYTSGTAIGRMDLYKDGLPGFQLVETYVRASYGQIIKNSSAVILASGTVMADGDSGALINNNAKGVRVYIDPGALGAGALGLTVTIQELDTVTGQYVDMLASTSLVASTPQLLRIYPGIATSANQSLNDFLPNTWRVKWSATSWGTGGSTLGIGCSLSE